MTTNFGGHGWVIPNPSGAVARCGGPGLCRQCATERKALEIWQARERTLPGRVKRMMPDATDLERGAWALCMAQAKGKS
jgi:hypothetical protein